MNVCLWHKADIRLLSLSVRFRGKSGRKPRGSLYRKSYRAVIQFWPIKFSVHVTVGAICRVSFMCAQALVETE